jgi:hypothetical protein
MYTASHKLPLELPADKHALQGATSKKLLGSLVCGPTRWQGAGVWQPLPHIEWEGRG